MINEKDLHSLFQDQLNLRTPYELVGRVHKVKGPIIETFLPDASIGTMVEVRNKDGKSVLGEVVSFDDSFAQVMCFEEMLNIGHATRIYLQGRSDTIDVHQGLLGHLVDYKGEILDQKSDKPFINQKVAQYPLYRASINPINRDVIDEPLDIGINAINSFITLGKGQRLAIMARSGVGKSTLMSMMAQRSKSDINVIALIGERGREVLEFVENELGPEGMKRTVVVASTSDETALCRVKAAYTATTIAEYFRDQGHDVLLMMDSVTRFAMAKREISSAIGEAPTQKGYSASVFYELPKLMERVGNVKNSGSITGIYTVLVEGGDFDEPISDAVRAITDGHLVLSVELAEKNHYPAIDILASVSRVMNKVVVNDHKVLSSHLRSLLAEYHQYQDLISVGAYAEGSNQNLDKAMRIKEHIDNFLKQSMDESFDIQECIDQMVEIAKIGEGINDPSEEQRE